jgi:AraC-like DNA-binding protein
VVAPFDFRPRPPTPELERHVESIWYARGTMPYARERIAPTGSTVAVFVLGDPLVVTADDGAGAPFTATTGFLLGPHDRPIVNEPQGETFAVGIVTTPVGCETVFRVPPASIRGRVVDLLATWPAAYALREQLLAAGDPEAMLDAIERHLLGASGPAIAGLDRCATAVALLEADPVRSIAEIAGELGVSHGHLDREFTRVVGLSPRALARLLRVRRLLHAIDVRGDVPWTALAADLGWYDQAHLIRDFKRHTGVPPSRYVAAQRERLAPDELDDSVGFVPEG